MKGIAAVIAAVVAVAYAGEICPPEGEFLVAHADCDRFYMCAHGTPVEMRCAGGLFFNTDISECDWPRYVDCGDRNVPATTEPDVDIGEGSGEGSGEDSGDGSGEGSGDDGSVEIELQENGCPVDHFIFWQFPSTTDCNQFYQCVWGKPVQRNCAPNLHFNPVLQVCDHPEDAGCNLSFNKHYPAKYRLIES